MTTNQDKFQDFIGKRFGQLTILEHLGYCSMSASPYKQHWYKARCDCGTEIIVRRKSLLRNRVKACRVCANKVSQDKLKSIIGQKFGKLTILGYLGWYKKDGTKTLAHYFKCQCDCGNIAEINYSSIIDGHTRSCGCLDIMPIKHDVSNRIFFGRWTSANNRCYNKLNSAYFNYGARGIYVDRQWIRAKYDPYYSQLPQEKQNEIDREHYLAFEKHFEDYAKKKLGLTLEDTIDQHYSIDRINNDGPYAPWNTRLVTQTEQCRNTRSYLQKHQFENRNQKKKLFENLATLFLNFGFQLIKRPKNTNYYINTNDQMITKATEKQISIKDKLSFYKFV